MYSEVFNFLHCISGRETMSLSKHFILCCSYSVQRYSQYIPMHPIFLGLGGILQHRHDIAMYLCIKPPVVDPPGYIIIDLSTKVTFQYRFSYSFDTFWNSKKKTSTTSTKEPLYKGQQLIYIVPKASFFQRFYYNPDHLRTWCHCSHVIEDEIPVMSSQWTININK